MYMSPIFSQVNCDLVCPSPFCNKDCFKWVRIIYLSSFTQIRNVINIYTKPQVFVPISKKYANIIVKTFAKNKIYVYIFEILLRGIFEREYFIYRFCIFDGSDVWDCGIPRSYRVAFISLYLAKADI